MGNGIAAVNSTAHTNSYFGANSQALSGPGGTSTSNHSGATSVGNATTTGFSLGNAIGGSNGGGTSGNAYGWANSAAN